MGLWEGHIRLPGKGPQGPLGDPQKGLQKGVQKGVQKGPQEALQRPSWDPLRRPYLALYSPPEALYGPYRPK